MNKLIEVLQVQSYSRKDTLMRQYLMNELASIQGVEFYDDGDNIYAAKGSAPYPCMVAHMDTVHEITSDLTAVVINGRITGMNAKTMTQTGIGGDDKVGIYVALEMLREHPNMKCFFPRDEEIGCVGSSHVERTFFDDVTIVLQCDRRGNTDFIINASGVELSSKAFQDDVLPIITEFGYKFEHGMMTDVMELKRQGINVSMANISCGYYNPHDDNEYVDAADVHRVTNMVSAIIHELGGTFYPHEAPPARRYYDRYDDLDGAGWGDYTHSPTSKYSLHNEPILCRDCQMQPATGINGLCDECWDWYKRINKIMPAPKEPNISVTIQRPKQPIKTVDDAIRAARKAKKDKRKRRWGY